MTPLALSILAFLNSERKQIRDTDIMVKFSVEKYDFDTAIAVLDAKNLIKIQRISSGGAIGIRINNYGIDYLSALPVKQTEAKVPPRRFRKKQLVIPEAVPILYNILKDFFPVEQQGKLKWILETGNDAGEKLLFMGNGNKLTDTFKKLIENNLITGWQKKDLQRWVIRNFIYLSRNKQKPFTADTVEKTISRNGNPCKNPLIEIVDGKIKRV